MSNNEQRIRELAYQIWENEGRPEGKTEQHWALARELVESESRGEAAATSAKPGRTRKSPKPDATPVEKPVLMKPTARKSASKTAPNDTATVRKPRKPRDQ